MTDKTLNDLTKRRHPEHEELSAHWDFLDACYKGGRAWFEEHIFQYIKEGEKEFTDRKARAYRFNHTREVIDLLNKYIFRVEVGRKEDAPDFIKKFWASASRNGEDINFMMRGVSKRSSTVGRVYVCVDNNMPSDSVISIADEKKLAIRTYAYVIRPQDVLDMSWDEFEELNWILIKEYYRDDADPITSSGKTSNRYRLWDRQTWKLYEEKQTKDKTVVVELINQGQHGLGVVPVFPVDHMEDDSPYSAPALVNDVAYLDRAVANYLSNLDAIIQDQSFSQLAMPAQAFMPGEEETASKKLIEMGTKRIFIYNAEGGVAPSYLSPDPRQATLIIIAIKQLINEIYHTVGMAGERTKQDNSEGVDNSSGVAKMVDFERVHALLTSKSESLRRAEVRMIQLVHLWNSKEISLEDAGLLVDYPKTFDVRDLMDDLEIAQKLSLLAAPDSVRQMQILEVADKLFPIKTDAETKKIEADVASWPPEPEVEEPAAGATTAKVVKKTAKKKADGAQKKSTAKAAK